MLCKKCKNISLTGICCDSEVESLEVLSLNQVIVKDVLSVKEEKATTDKLTCPKCASNKIQIKAFQNRSADEGVTVRLNCLNCGYKESGDSVSANL